MTGSNLIALAPWIIFGAALAAVYARLLGSRHGSSRPAERPPACSWEAADRGSAEAAPQRAGQPPGCDQHGAASP